MFTSLMILQGPFEQDEGSVAYRLSRDFTREE